MQETPVWALSREEPLEKEIAIHSSIFAWETPRTEEPGRLQSMELQRDNDIATKQQQQNLDIKIKTNRQTCIKFNTQ